MFCYYMGYEGGSKVGIFALYSLICEQPTPILVHKIILVPVLLLIHERPIIFVLVFVLVHDTCISVWGSDEYSQYHQQHLHHQPRCSRCSVHIPVHKTVPKIYVILCEHVYHIFINRSNQRRIAAETRPNAHVHCIGNVKDFRFLKYHYKCWEVQWIYTVS